MTSPTGVTVSATGSSLPQRVMRNEDFCALVDTSDEWIRTRTGIRERRIAGPGQNSATLGLEASRRALEAAGLSPADLDLILCASVTPPLMTPATANLIQAGLGCRPVPAMDILAACTGFLYALSVGEKFVRTGAARHVLVVGAEVLSQVTDYTDRNTCILFGDGAGAVVLSGCDRPGAGIHSVQLYSDGTRQGFIQVPSLVTTPPPHPAFPPEGNAPPGGPEPPGLRPPGFLRMNGREVFKFAVQRMVELIEDAALDCARLGKSIDLLIPHQVNQRIIDAALDHTGFPPEKVMVNLDRYGNTSAASVPIALDEAVRAGRAGPGDTLLLIAFGGGLTWGSVILTL